MPSPTMAVWKFASCDGCQLTLLDCEDELLTLADAVHISHFLEMSSEVESGAVDLMVLKPPVGPSNSGLAPTNAGGYSHRVCSRQQHSPDRHTIAVLIGTWALV